MAKPESWGWRPIKPGEKHRGSKAAKELSDRERDAAMAAQAPLDWSTGRRRKPPQAFDVDDFFDKPEDDK